MVGHGGDEHPCDVRLVESLADCRSEHAFCAVGIPNLDVVTEPLGQSLARHVLRRKRLLNEKRRFAGTFVGDFRQSDVQRSAAVLGPNVVQQVRHHAERRQPPAPPALAIVGAELRPEFHGDGGRNAFRLQSDDGFGDHEVDVLLQSVLETVAPVFFGRFGARWVRLDVHLAVADLDGVGLHVVGERIEGVPAGQFEPRVMPVAGEHTVVHRPFREGKTHVRTAVVHRVKLVFVEE